MDVKFKEAKDAAGISRISSKDLLKQFIEFVTTTPWWAQFKASLKRLAERELKAELAASA